MARFNQSLFFLISGISIGVFTELFLPEGDKAQVASHLMEHLFTDYSLIDHSAVFFESAQTHLGLLAFLFLSGLTAFGIPASYIALAYQGIALGFSSALLMESLAFRGAIAMILAVLPPQLLILPALFLAVSNIAKSHSRRSGNRRKKSLSVEPGPYCRSFLLPLILIVTAIFLEAFISPAFLQLIRSQ